MSRYITFGDKIDGKKVWTTADIHGYHRNLTKGVSCWSDTSGCRDFCDEYVMTQEVVDSINSIVPPDGVLIHLGDWSFGGKDKIERLRKLIYCKNILHIFGNHDKSLRRSKSFQDLFIGCFDYLELYVSDHNEKYKLICMSHYGMRVWNESHKGSIHLFGHSHGTLPPLGRSMDVGWDVHRKPLLLADIIDDMRKIEPHKVDHHGEHTT